MILSCLLSTNKEIERINGIINTLELSNIQKNILKERYSQIIYDINNRTTKYSRVYHIGHFIITVGSLFVPALLSVQYSNTGGENIGERYQINIFWSTWVISLLVTIFNGILTLYRVDKKYYLLNTVLERLRSEGWQYFSLTGRYSGHLINHITPSHTNQFIYFCYAIEKISLKLVAEEFFKNNDKSESTLSSSNNSQSITEQSKNNYSVSNDMYIPSPDNNIISPKPVKDVVNSIIRSRKTINSISKNDINTNDINTQDINADKYKHNNYKNEVINGSDDTSIYIDNLSNYTLNSDNMSDKNSEEENTEGSDQEEEIVNKNK
jgi:hypothetical protein